MRNKSITIKRLSGILLMLCILCFGIWNNAISQEHEQNHPQTEVTEHHPNPDVEHKAHAEHEGHGHNNMAPLLFIIVALIIGAATRHLLRKSPLPYTVTLLIIGIGLGAITRMEFLEGGVMDSLSKSFEWAGHVDPHVILYVFLPTLIFEAAFAMEVHTFKKTLTNATLLAVPGIIIAMLLTGALMVGISAVGIGEIKWSWTLALMFGAIISATDPVAVVAVLKELGASKKLGTLIEGESLLNDGTAIVIFMVFFMMFTEPAAAGNPVLDFIYVAFGGAALGFIIGHLSISWVRRVFNDALVEISVILAASYMAFFIAEHFLHVSGVLSLVTLGLVVAGIGRTRISPEVEHFLHEFWEFAAYVANTLIFIMVGVIIAQRVDLTSGTNFLILGILFVSIHIIRAIVIFILYPLMKVSGYGISRKDSYVLWWGALRGAVGLALALIVASVQAIPEAVRDQILFLTFGIVTLTLLVNATTMSWLVDKLGITKIAPAKAVMIYSANKYLRQSTENQIERIKQDRFMGRANWKAVEKYLPKEPVKKVEENLKIETIAEMRRRILEKEKSSYWHQFKDGLLGSVAVRKLSDGILEILDAGGMISLAERKDLEEMWKTPKSLIKMQAIPLFGSLADRLIFDRLRLSYDCARGFVEAQLEALKLVESMYRSIQDDDIEGKKNLAIIEGEINENKIEGQTFIRILRKNYPEIYDSIATRQAIRSMLNYERHTVERLQKNGRIDSGEAQKMTISIEERMKRLMFKPPVTEIEDTSAHLKGVPLLSGLDDKSFKKVVDMFQSKVYASGENLIKENDTGDSLYVIQRGNVRVSIGEQVVAVLGPGGIIGEMSVLTGLPRNATVTAEGPVTALRLKYLKVQRLISETNDLELKLWDIAGRRFAKDVLIEVEPYSVWRSKKMERWLDKGEVQNPDEGEIIDLSGRVAVILSGKAIITDESKYVINAPAIIDAENVTLVNNARLFTGPKEE